MVVFLFKAMFFLFSDILPTMFETKVKHIAAILEDGVRELVPGIDAMVPGAADGLFDVFVVDSHEWATASSASGKIAVSSRLAGAIGMEDLLAYLIAREMVHVVVSHHEQNSAASIITSIAMNLVIPGSGLIKSAVSLGGAAIAANANREEQERRADELASVVLRAAGFNPQEAHTAIALFSRSPAFADWSGRLRATAGHVLAKANAATGQNANAKASATAAAESQKPGGGQKALRIQPAGVVSFVAGGAIIQTSTEDLRKVAASSGRATSYYND